MHHRANRVPFAPESAQLQYIKRVVPSPTCQSACMTEYLIVYTRTSCSIIESFSELQTEDETRRAELSAAGDVGSSVGWDIDEQLIFLVISYADSS